MSYLSCCGYVAKSDRNIVSQRLTRYTEKSVLFSIHILNHKVSVETFFLLLCNNNEIKFSFSPYVGQINGAYNPFTIKTVYIYDFFALIVYLFINNKINHFVELLNYIQTIELFICFETKENNVWRGPTKKKKKILIVAVNEINTTTWKAHVNSTNQWIFFYFSVHSIDFTKNCWCSNKK